MPSARSTRRLSKWTIEGRRRLGAGGLERSPRAYDAWKNDVASVPLETYGCDGREVLLVLDRYRAEAIPSVALVRTFAAAEWAALPPKLDRALKLDP